MWLRGHEVVVEARDMRMHCRVEVNLDDHAPVPVHVLRQGRLDERAQLCTDLVARGLDIPAVKAVLNFSFPVEPKRYLHRIGRTARAGSHGVAVTLCNDEERKEIKKLLRKLGQNVNNYVLSTKMIQETHEFIAK